MHRDDCSKQLLFSICSNGSQRQSSGNGLTTALLAHNASQSIVVCDSLLSCKLVSAIRACPHLSVLKLVFKLGKQIQKSQKNDGLLIQRECRFRRHLILLSFVPSSSKNKDDSKFFTEIDSIRSPNEILQNFLTAKLCRYLRSQKIDRRCKTCSQRRR